MSNVLTMEEAAKFLRISRTGLYKAIREGRGPKVRKIGDRSVILQEDLEKFIENLPAAG